MQFRTDPGHYIRGRTGVFYEEGRRPSPRCKEHAMPDKTPHQQLHKKPVKNIKEKRAEKKAKNPIEGAQDPVAHLKKRR